MADFDLHTKLRSAIEERLALAQAATPGPWRVAAEGSEGSRIAPAYGTLREQARWIALIGGRVQPEDGRNARHMAANGPDHVIRACRADLARLHRHAAKGWSAEQVAKTPAVADERWCESCNYTAWPCPEIRSLAKVWLPENET